ncbi:universal stress protein [Agromyces badenianii]|uniref:universal stress protein n=1 Tax=Agromyces badenianii TaxID=2080742 RepID=UPI000D597F95|nr:universal stress protein [Agromyces badenianii]PWC04160.1 universal stress protein [Agromyces badenianii]
MHSVVVGVTPGQPPVVVLHAAAFAARFQTDLVCAHVNPGRFVTAEAADGSVSTSSIDPDFGDEREGEFDAELAAALGEILAPTGAAWRPLALAGDVARALGHLADTLDASMIVVGAHEHSVSGSIQEFFNRSIGVQLAHQQSRPVVIIPARAPGVRSYLPGKE